MRFQSLITGSEGNASILECGATTILIDCGFPTKKLLNEKIPVNKKIDAIFITHDHIDHLSNWTGRFAIEQNIPVFLHQTHIEKDKARKDSYLDNKNGKVETFTIDSGKTLVFKDLNIKIFEGEHCSRSNWTNTQKIKTFGFTFNEKFGYLTDTGMITNEIKKNLLNVETLALEVNYDEEMLLKGDRYHDNKLRSYENMGHLSNIEAFKFCKMLVESGKLKKLIVLHMSETFNTKDIVTELFAPLNIEIIIADRNEGTKCIDI